MHPHLMNGTAVKPPSRKIWRARILPKELEDAGFNAPDADGWAILRGLLLLKGIPASLIEDERNFRASVDKKTGVLTVEFKET